MKSGEGTEAGLLELLQTQVVWRSLGPLAAAALFNLDPINTSFRNFAALMPDFIDQVG